MTPKSQNESPAHRSRQDLFRQFAKHTAEAVGTPAAFFAAVLLILVWAGTGPFFHFSDTWQLVVNTATTIVTFLMVFLIQNTQNRDSRALHLKLDELIKATARARNSIIDVANLSEEQLKRLEEEYRKLCTQTAQGQEQKQERKN
jgi:low affinity Fe/Cu permease